MPEFTIRVCCSKGTYIRTLCHDIGQKLGCGAALASLVRTRSGSFVIEEAYTLDHDSGARRSKGRLSEAVTAVEKMFESLPAAAVKREALKALQNGNQLKEAELVFQKESGGAKNRIARCGFAIRTGNFTAYTVMTKSGRFSAR